MDEDHVTWSKFRQNNKSDDLRKKLDYILINWV